jgi:hypothetical protein
MLRVESVECLDNYHLKTRLSNGAEGLFDVTPYLDKGIFTELKNLQYFHAVKINFAGVCWPHGQDFSADTIEYELKRIK